MIINGATHLRKLSLRSQIKFGHFKHLTVGELINLGHFSYLIKVYYTASNISYTDEVLDILCLTEERRIKKPGKGRSPCPIWQIVKDARHKNLSVQEFKKTPNIIERQFKREKAFKRIVNLLSLVHEF